MWLPNKSTISNWPRIASLGSEISLTPGMFGECSGTAAEFLGCCDEHWNFEFPWSLISPENG